jgi:autophagy-related protein 33
LYRLRLPSANLQVSIPTILGLSTPAAASAVLSSTLVDAKRFLLPLEWLASGSFLLAFVLSSSRTRHPYLLYASLGGLGMIPYTMLVMAPLTRQILYLGKVSDVNGEDVNGALKKWQYKNFGRVAISGIAFILAVIGGYGDTFED